MSQDGGTGFNFLARDIAFAAESRHLQSRGDIRQGRGSLIASDVANSALSKDSVATIAVVVRRLPEGVWLATSDDLPGLIVETKTREEAIDRHQNWPWSC